eukprot:PITA_19498
MVEEYDSIVRNSVWDVVPRQEDKLVVSSRWLYKVKQAADGSLEKHKTRFVARGFSQFEMKDMGLMHYFHGMEVWQGDEELFLSQGKYANEILRRFRMESSEPMEIPLAGNWRKEYATSGEVVEATVYRQLVGSLLYLVNTRSDMCYVVNQLSQAMVRPTKLY